jgi:hypothetical protein
MNDDLGISPDEYDWLLTIFYIPYILVRLQVKESQTNTC